MHHSSVVVHDFNVKRIATIKPEAHPPLVDDTNAPLPNSVATQGFETIGWRLSQVFHDSSRVKLR
jgi:hypothetical protein